MELAADYAGFGAWDDAIDVLARLMRSDNRRAASYPLLHYYAGYAAQKKGAVEEAAKYFKARRKCLRQLLPGPTGDYRRAAHSNEAQPRGRDGPPLPGKPALRSPAGRGHQGVGEGRRPGSKVATVYRNLGVGYEQTKRDRKKAIEYYEKAVAWIPWIPG